jgi:hypothetical protein
MNLKHLDIAMRTWLHFSCNLAEAALLVSLFKARAFTLEMTRAQRRCDLLRSGNDEMYEDLKSI